MGIPREPGELWGIPAELTDVGRQSDFFAELVNKLSWAVGSTYRVGYKSPKQPLRAEMIKMATRIIMSEGYGKHLEK